MQQISLIQFVLPFYVAVKMCCTTNCSGANCHCEDFCTLCVNCERCNPKKVNNGIGAAGMAGLGMYNNILYSLKKYKCND